MPGAEDYRNGVAVGVFEGGYEAGRTADPGVEGVGESLVRG